MTTAPKIHQILSATEPLLALNNAHSIELSPLTLSELDQIIRASFFSASIDDYDALLISFDQSYPHEHENLRWLRGFFGKKSDQDFVYVDRVVVSHAARGKGYARALYTELSARAKSAGHTRIVCEVNFIPPNPISDAFHAGLGFHEIGRAALLNSSKTVRYLLRPL